MEVIQVFNKELKSILEAKLPVSRHKMSMITKSAMKALKFYKHVVQSVEKFITKCSCDYKVPGLYVIDAIVRQSKHQYCDKDVFVPRFMRNIVLTFINLSQCDPKDLTSIERVLRLWQQNGVFPTDLVESLLELVYDATDNDKVLMAGNIVLKLVNEWNVLKGKPEEELEMFIPHMDSIITSTDTPKAEGGLIDSITKLLTRFQAETGQDVSLEIDQIQILHQKIVEQSALLAQGEMIDTDTLAQLHQSMEELTKKAAKAAAVQQSKLAMLASDDKDHTNEASTDLEFVEQLQQMVDTLGQTRALQEELKQALECKHNIVNDETEDVIIVDQDFRGADEGEEPFPLARNEDLDLRVIHNNNNVVVTHYDNHNEHNNTNNVSYDKLSRSPSNGSRKRRRLSDSESGFMKRTRSRSREPRRKEKTTHESRKRWMPPLRDQCVGILSRTMFIGHLHKHVSESKLRTLCEEYGTIAEFNMIPPRGCAFVSFDKRKSAYKAILKMHESKFEGRDLKVAWAPNKGVKDEKEFRDNWVEDNGCTYIPTEQFPINRSSDLTEGFGELDEDSLTEELKQAIYQFEQQKSVAVACGIEPSSVDTVISVAAEVVNKKITLISPNENMTDGNTPFFNQFSTPPPMLPPMISSFPPPLAPLHQQHMFMVGMPPLPLRPDLSLLNNMVTRNPNVVDYQQRSISNADQGVVSTHMHLDTPTDGLSPSLSSPHHHQQHQHHSQPSMTPSINDHLRLRHNPPFLRPPIFMNPAMMSPRPRYAHPPMRYQRQPPPGFPVFRPGMIGRPHAPRF